MWGGGGVFWGLGGGVGGGVGGGGWVWLCGLGCGVYGGLGGGGGGGLGEWSRGVRGKAKPKRSVLRTSGLRETQGEGVFGYRE